MKITFLVGNGFDVGLGIKSSYSAFYNWYCDTPSGKKHIEKFKNDIKPRSMRKKSLMMSENGLILKAG